MSNMADLHAISELLKDLESIDTIPEPERIRREREGDFWVALMNIAYHPNAEENQLSLIAKEVLEKHSGTAQP